MLRHWLPGFCSRLSIFLSYSSEHRGLAEKIAQTLKNSGHRVFFDKDSLPPAGDYNERIRNAIHNSDRFLFLVSRTALEKGKYTLTELDFARQRWPSPVGRVFPVIIDPELRPDALPTYLSSVQTLSITGNAPAEIAATMEQTGNVNTVCWTCLGVSTLALMGVVGLATGVIPIPSSFVPADIVLAAPEYVHFRPRARPPDDPSAPGADTSWTSSPVTITLPVAYSSRNARSAPAQILGEEVELQIGDRKEKYSWTYVVEIMSASIADTRCADWLCQKANVTTENLKPGETTGTRETMFLPASSPPLLWKQFIDPVVAPDGPAIAKVILRSRIVVANGSKKSDVTRELECRVDVADARQHMIAVGYKPGLDPRPPTWQPSCLQK
jgi:TIR domain